MGVWFTLKIRANGSGMGLDGLICWPGRLGFPSWLDWPSCSGLVALVWLALGRWIDPFGMGSGGLCWSAWVRTGLHLIRRFLALPSRRWPHPASSSFSGLVLSGGWSRSRSGSAFTLLIGWLLGWSWWSVSHPASRLVMVSSGLVAGSALPVPMALAPRSMLGSAFGAVSSCLVR